MGNIFSMDELGADVRQQMEVRVCRTIDCGLDAFDGNVFCVKCSDEIEAVRAAARRRFVIFGISGSGRPAPRPAAIQARKSSTAVGDGTTVPTRRRGGHLARDEGPTQLSGKGGQA